MCGEEYIDFYVGEVRELDGCVLPQRGGETVVITSAKYEVTPERSEEIITSGNCRINGNEFSATLTFHESGIYVFTVTIEVGTEKVIEKAYIRVRG